MKQTEHVIGQIVGGSIAEELELEAGDVLLAVNDQKIEDIFDYQYLCEDTQVLLLVRKKDGEEWELEIEKEEDEDLGLVFENGLMADYKSCRNNCIFCFIDQMPKGMRETLYFKDDDSRLSFLQGNYVTLTNMSEHDIDRIIQYRLSPINISFHTTNPQLRCEMLHNRFAGTVFSYVDRLYEAGITMNGQIVLCKGVNDGAELERSLRELSRYAPILQSVSVVPVGLTKYREGLYPLEPFTKEDARAVLSTIHSWQERVWQDKGSHFVHAGDEWYILAEQEIPPEETYDGYLQLENGVGMVRLFQEEFAEELSRRTGDDRSRTVSVATGVLAAPYLQKAANQLQKKYPHLQINVYTIRNDFFGERITVAGLLTGQDLLAQLKDVELGEKLILPGNVLRMGEDVFLDDMTLEGLQEELQITIEIAGSSGYDFIEAIVGG